MNSLITKPFYYLFFIGLLLSAGGATASAQVNVYKLTADTVTQDSVKVRGKANNNTSPLTIMEGDTLPKTKKTKSPGIKKPKVPWKAGLMSGCLPGLGQFYNGKWWKAPIVWGAVGTVGYFIVTNHISYIGFRDAYRQYDLNGTVPAAYQPTYNNNPSGLISQRDYFRRTRDLLIIIEAALWTLNIVDATVDAHLSTFDVSEDLTLHVYPSSFYIPQVNQTYVGLSLNLNVHQVRSKTKRGFTF